jgi:hypothetical protein
MLQEEEEEMKMKIRGGEEEEEEEEEECSIYKEIGKVQTLEKIEFTVCVYWRIMHVT